MSARSRDAFHGFDRGCDVSPTCLACHLPECRYESHGNLERNRRMLAMAASDMKAGEIAAALGMRPRTVRRLLQIHRERGGEQGLGGTHPHAVQHLPSEMAPVPLPLYLGLEATA